MKPLTVDLLASHYDKYSPQPLFDCNNLEFAEWEDTIGRKYTGTRDKVSQKPQGIVRIVTPGDNIVEGTFIDGARSGLFRFTEYDYASITMYEEVRYTGNIHVGGFFKFSDSFIETNRVDDSELLKDLSVADF